MSSLKKYLRDLNLFKPAPNSDEVETDNERRLNIIATRIYIIILILTLFSIGLVLSLIDQTTIITLKYPIKETLETLPKDVKCPCSRISIPHGKFTSINTSFHQVCSSDFVTDRWFNAINSGSNSSYLFGRDFRIYGSAQFQALAGFCRLSKANIKQNIDSFALNTLLSPQVLSEKVLRSKIEASIDQLKLTAPNTFKSQLGLLIQMTASNQLLSGLQTNSRYMYRITSNSRQDLVLGMLIYRQDDGSICQCDISICNKISSAIYNVFGATITIVADDIEWYIPGISAGCLPVNSILVSTLECFFNQTCVNKLVSYLTTNTTFTAMNAVVPSRYNLSSTVQSITDKLMIEDWVINISYNEYYSHCAPSSCTYLQLARNSFVFVLTKLISLLASLTLVFELVIPYAIRFIQRLRDPTPRLRVPFCIRLRKFKVFIQRKIVEMNLFRQYSSTDRQRRYQRYATRLYVILMLISIGILFVYTLLQKSIQYKTVSHPTESEYIKLEKYHSNSLSCPCTSISIPHSTFITIQPHYHQLCSSDLISDRWIAYLRQVLSTPTNMYRLDYRVLAPGQFKSLFMLCQHAKQTINDAHQVFLQTQLISSQVISQETFDFQVNLLIRDWKFTTVNTSMHTLRLIRATTQGNQLSNGFANTKTYFNSISREIIREARIYSGCSCALSPLCRENVGLWYFNESTHAFDRTYLIPNFFTGCYSTEVLFASTLECFYNISCMLQIHSYLSSNHSFTFSPLDANRSWPYETIETIVNQLMIDKWAQNISFTSYYNECAPLSCTFQYENRNTLLDAITAIISIFGGLSLGFQLIIWIGLQIINKIMTNEFSYLTLLRSIKDMFICNTEHQIIRRIHIIFVVTTLCTIYFFSAFNPRTTTIEKQLPSLSIYEDLIAKPHDSLNCPCSQISVKYKSFLNIKSRFHEICSSDFVSDQWITYQYENVTPLYRSIPTDFYSSSSGQFQLLASFCELSKQIVNNSLVQLGASDFINIQLLPLNQFEDRIRTTVNEFQLTIPNLFVNTLSLIRVMTGANMLTSILSTNWVLTGESNLTKEWFSHSTSLEYNRCSCALSSKCVSASRGMLAGCYPLEAILQSTLGCLYDQRCIDSTNIFKAINISSSISSHFPIDATVESIVNKLMVEEFLTTMSYELYFKQCAPLSCTYSSVNNKNIIEGIITLIGLYGGLLIICHLFAIFIVKQFLRIKSRVSPTTD